MFADGLVPFGANGFCKHNVNHISRSRVYILYVLLAQWCHKCVMASLNTGTSTVFFNGLFRLTATKHPSSALLDTFEGNQQVFIVTDGFPSQSAINAASVSMPCRHCRNILWYFYGIYNKGDKKYQCLLGRTLTSLTTFANVLCVNKSLNHCITMTS